MATPIAIVAYLALFAAVGAVFLFANLLVGRFLRPKNPNEEKLEIYECGEPTIGSSFVQFDLRYYVVALLFLIFEVEIAFFFPWATVFGKANHLRDEQLAVVEVVEQIEVVQQDEVVDVALVVLSEDAAAIYRELGVAEPAVVVEQVEQIEGREVVLVVLSEDAAAIYRKRGVAKAADETLGSGAAELAKGDEAVRQGSRQLALFSLFDIGVFFAVLLVGFAYVWKRGDLDWVRAVSRDRAREQLSRPPPSASEEEPVLSA